MNIIKIGGAEGINYDYVLCDIALRWKKGEKCILVHGGKEKLNRLSTQLNNPPKWVTSISGFTSRYTDKKTIEQFIMVYAGQMNKMIVRKLLALDIRAVGLCGMDGRTVTAKRKLTKIIDKGKKRILRDDYTGKIISVNPAILLSLLDMDILPVITPPAVGVESEPLNVDGDRMTAAIAGAVCAENVIYLSNIPGLLKDKDDDNSLIQTISKDGISGALTIAKGTMKKKIMGAKESLEKGVQKIILADSRVKYPVSNALDGRGTLIS